jgi:hypothetical protein
MIEVLKQALATFKQINKLSQGENAICLPAEIDDVMDSLEQAIKQSEKTSDKKQSMRRAIYELDQSLWRARTEAIRESNYHTQLGHAIDAVERLKVAFGIAIPQPDTGGTRSWFTVDELNAWADEYEDKQKEKNNG